MTTPSATPTPSADLTAPLKSVQETATDFSIDVVDWVQTSTLHAVAVVLAAVACGLFLRLLRTGILRLVKGKRDEAELHGLRLVIWRLVANTSVIFLTVLGFWVFTLFLKLPKGVVKGLDFAFMLTGAFQAALIVREVLLLFFERRLRVAGGGAPVNSALGVIGWLVNIGVWSITLLLLLDNLGVNVTALVAGLGIGGLAIGLAAQGIISDLFSALSIVFDRPFVRGDFIIFGQKTGTVERIGLKTTRVRSLSGEMIVVSNNQLLGEVIHNYQQMVERRVVFKLGVTYDTPADELEAIPARLRQAVEAVSSCRFDRAHMTGFGDNSLDFEIVYYFRGRDYTPYMDAHQAILLRIMRDFKAHGISFAFPTRTVHLVQDSASRTTGAASARPAPAVPGGQAGSDGTIS